MKSSKSSDAPEVVRRRTRQRDQVDQSILTALVDDGRRSNRELGRVVGVTEGTVRRRLRRAESSNSMRVVASRNLKAAGFQNMAAIGVCVRGRDASAVADELARLPQVLSVSLTLGANDIELQVIGRNLLEITELLTKVLPNVRGVSRLDAGLALTVFKYQPQWAAFDE